MRYSEFVKGYRQLQSKNSITLFPSGLTEYVIPIYENQYTRILLLKEKKAPDTVRIEIEVNLPQWMWGLSANQYTNGFYPNQRTLQRTLEEMIRLFQYLLKLQQAGFKLDFIKDEGIWIAFFDLTAEPTNTFYRQLKPPEIAHFEK
jgi:hypothetical protein